MDLDDSESDSDTERVDDAEFQKAFAKYKEGLSKAQNSDTPTTLPNKMNPPESHDERNSGDLSDLVLKALKALISHLEDPTKKVECDTAISEIIYGSSNLSVLPNVLPSSIESLGNGSAHAPTSDSILDLLNQWNQVLPPASLIPTTTGFFEEQDEGSVPAETFSSVIEKMMKLWRRPKGLELHTGALDDNAGQKEFRKRHEYELVLKPTDPDARTCIVGKGKFGSVYLAKMSPAKSGMAPFKDNYFCVKRMDVNQFKKARYTDTLESIVTQASLDHENIVKIRGIFSENWIEEGDSINLLMPYYQDGSFEELIKTLKGVPLKDAVIILKQMASALNYLEEKWIVHRNVKASNIVLRKTGADSRFHASLTGFSFAKKLSSHDGHLGPYDIRQGNPVYLSPERCRNETYDGRSDVWCLGILMYFALLGNVPLSLRSKSSDVLYRIGYTYLDDIEKGMETGLQDAVKNGVPVNITTMLQNLMEGMLRWVPDNDPEFESDKLLDQRASKRFRASQLITQELFNESSIELIPSTYKLNNPDGTDTTPQYTMSYIGQQLDVQPYPHTASKRGICIIINDRNFAGTINGNYVTDIRDGTDHDKKRLKSYFTENDYECITKDNLKESEMKALLNQVARKYDENPEYDTLVVCILSHGRCKHILDVEWKPVQVAELTSIFDKEHCPNLEKKPKVFIIQACQDNSTFILDEMIDKSEQIKKLEKEADEILDKYKKLPKNADSKIVNDLRLSYIEKDDECIKLRKDMKLENENLNRLIPRGEDFVLAMSTLFGYKSYRDDRGSFFITELCKYLKSMDTQDLLRILCRVTDSVEKKLKQASDYIQTPGVVTSAKKLIYLGKRKRHADGTQSKHHKNAQSPAPQSKH